MTVEVHWVAEARCFLAMRSIRYYRELSPRWVKYSSGLRGLSVALKDIQAFVKPCLLSEFFFLFLFLPTKP